MPPKDLTGFTSSLQMTRKTNTMLIGLLGTILDGISYLDICRNTLIKL